MSAVISECGQYRYRLDRNLLFGTGVVAFIGVNPSTADAIEDDQTIKKMLGFAAHWGYLEVIVCNLFAYRDKDVSKLSGVSDPVGPLHAQYLAEVIEAADLIVPCWGSRKKMPRHLRSRPDECLDMLRLAGKPLKHLGLTTSGDPAHPMILSYNTPLITF